MKKVVGIVWVAVLSLCLASSAFAGKLGNFEVKDAGGQKFSQENIKGKKAVLAFVQAACSQCRTEVKDLADKVKELKDKAELYLVIVDVNSERALEFFKAEGAPGILISDPDFKIGAAADVTSTPSTVVVDKDLNIIKSKTGYRPGDIDKLIGEL